MLCPVWVFRILKCIILMLLVIDNVHMFYLYLRNSVRYVLYARCTKNYG